MEETQNILDDVYNSVGQFVAFPNEHTRVAHTVYSFYTHIASECYFAPRLYITAATTNCGKTRLKNITKLLVHNPMVFLNPTPAPMFRIIDKEHPTMMIEQVDRLFSKKEIDDLLNIIEVGFENDGTTIPRMSDDNSEAIKYNVFGPMILIGIDKGVPDPITNRSVIDRLRRTNKAKANLIPFRPRKHSHIFKDLNKRMGEVGTEAIKIIKGLKDNDPLLEPVFPEDWDGRFCDKWESLIIAGDVVDRVFGGSGVWGERVRDAAAAYQKEEQGMEPIDDAELVVGHIGTIFRDLAENDYMFSEDLRNKLIDDIPDSPWAVYPALTTKGLANLLKPFGIHSVPIRKEKNKAAYYKHFFKNVFEDYGAPLPTGTPSPLRTTSPPKFEAPTRQKTIAEINEMNADIIEENKRGISF